MSSVVQNFGSLGGPVQVLHRERQTDMANLKRPTAGLKVGKLENISIIILCIVFFIISDKLNTFVKRNGKFQLKKTKSFQPST
jgi:hypothetical protein